jgi:hypothetical protein
MIKHHYRCLIERHVSITLAFSPPFVLVAKSTVAPHRITKEEAQKQIENWNPRIPSASGERKVGENRNDPDESPSFRRTESLHDSYAVMELIYTFYLSLFCQCA